MKLVLDTNAYSALMRNDPAIMEFARSATALFLPAPVLGEILFGINAGSRAQNNKQKLRRFLSAPFVHFAATDETVCERYALIAHQLRRKGRPIPTNDIWIAAHALALGADLLSQDQHFSHIDGLSWLHA